MQEKLAKRAILLLGFYQQYLESEVDCHLIAGSDRPMPGSKRRVSTARKRWCEAETLINDLLRELNP